MKIKEILITILKEIKSAWFKEPPIARWFHIYAGLTMLSLLFCFIKGIPIKQALFAAPMAAAFVVITIYIFATFRIDSEMKR